MNEIPEVPFRDVEISDYQEDQSNIGRTLKFNFKGTAGEYFSIWIVNLLLIIITLGLYSPWAKVRRLRYFYGNTQFYNRVFDFTGIPRKILIGRLIALSIYFVFSFLGGISITLFLIGLVLIYLAIPFLLQATIRFNSRNSKFGNSRFYFDGTKKQAYKEFFKGILVYIFTLGIFFPVLIWLYKRFLIDNLFVGQLKFTLHADWSKFMSAVYIPVFIFIGLTLTVAAVMFGLAMSNTEMLVGFLSSFYLLGFLLLGPWIAARVFITTWNNVSLGTSKFQTNANQWRFAWIMASNFIAIILSVGLLSAWAAIRIHKYKVESLSLTLNDDPDHLYNLAQNEPGTIAEEISDIFDFDFSL